MTSVHNLPRSRRSRDYDSARRRHFWIVSTCAPLLAALALCTAIDAVDAAPRAPVPIPPRDSAISLIPAAKNGAMHAADLTATTFCVADASDDRANLQPLTVATVPPAEITGAIPEQQADMPTPKPSLQTPVIMPQQNRVPTAYSVRLQERANRSPSRALGSLLAPNDHSSILAALARLPKHNNAGVSRLRLALLAPQTLVLRPLNLPSAIKARVERNGASWPQKLVGIASMYDPGDPNDKDAGNGQTASGEMYDGMAWSAAIRTDFRGRFGGVHYGRNYRPAYALLETDSKRVIVKINDVGPLAFGRVIDLNKRTMRFFDPTLRLGLIHGIRVIPLPGPNWTPGPIDNDGETIRLASASGA